MLTIAASTRRPVAARISAAVASSRSRLRAARTRSAPASASCWAMARPSPVAAPVTSAVCPATSSGWKTGIFGGGG
jgi:hypothetical protein